MLVSLLRSIIHTGQVSLALGDGPPTRIGSPGTGPEICIRLVGRLTPLRLALNPDMALGEAYMDGRLIIEHGTLDDLFELIGRNLAGRAPPPAPLQALIRVKNRMARNQRPKASARNVAHHYDLSHRFYRAFLDADLQYSCAYFERADLDLESAQQAKVRHILAKLDLRPGQRVLDIGSGWGGLVLSIAKAADVHVTGVTLSREQLAIARRRALAEGLSERVAFELMDYRQVPGGFDRVVSVGMFEHVGPRHYGTFFNTVQRLLTAEGVALIHSIGARRDGGGSNPWIRKHIFPGGYIPTLSETIGAIEPTGLWVCDVEVLRLHYAYTLERWLERFRLARSAAAELYDERFCRMWEFYLAGCAMGFRHGDLMVMQLQLAKQVDTLPITRDYIQQAEQQLSLASARTGGEVRRLQEAVG